MARDDRLPVLTASSGVLVLVLGVGCPEASRSVARTDKSWASVSVGWNHAFALADDGEIRCWGCGSVKPGVRTDLGSCSPPPGSFVELAVGTDHTCAIAANGESLCWGCGVGGSAYGFPNGR